MTEPSRSIGTFPRTARIKIGQARLRARKRVTSQASVLAEVPAILDALTTGVLLTDDQQRIIHANQELAELFGLPNAAELHGLPLTAFGERIAKRLSNAEELQRVLSEPLATLQVGVTHEWQVEPARRTIQHISSPVYDYFGQPVGRVDSFIDVTEERTMQAQLVNSEKLRALGVVASGVVHDFNNLLAGILGRTEILLLEVQNEQLRDALMTIRQAAVDGATAVRRIQEHVRVQHNQDFEPTSIGEVIRLAAQITQPVWKDHTQRAGGTINVTLDIEDDLVVMGSGSELREVIVNMLLNSVDAMPTGGTISIVARRNGNEVQITISDTGIGMDEETCRHVFDPFFTTKGTAGTGLGLSIAYGIICRHGGTVTVESAEQRGTTFTISLPLIEGVSTSQEAADAAPPQPCRILLLDDEPQVLTTIQLMLCQDEHSVDACTDPMEALARLGAAPYDVLVTDLGMPGLNGWEVAARAKAIRPDVRVILLTGWAAELDTAALRTRGVDGLLSKPCSLTDLRRTLTSVLQPAQPVHRKILVVDDQQRFAAALAQRLELDGHQTAIAASAAEGLQHFESSTFDIAFVDLCLPDGQGTDLAAAIKQQAPSAFVVLMTGFATSVDDELIATAAVDAVLPKPWRGSELEGVLARATQGTSAPPPAR